jgi:phage virion morphogenesis protein
MRPLMGEFVEILLEGARRRFDEKVGPDGLPWAALTPETIERKREKGAPKPESILVEWGNMVGQMTNDYGKDWAEVTVPAIQAATHQFGRGGIPARPFLGVSAEELAEMLEAAQDYYRVKGGAPDTL